MVIWLASYPRSGNTFFRVVLNSAFGIRTCSIYDDRLDIGADPKLAEVVGHEFLPQNFDLDAARQSGKLWFIKTHGMPETGESDRVIYLLRDGRAASLSLRRYLADFAGLKVGLSDVIRGNAPFGSWGAHVDAWTPDQREDTLLIRFEDLVSDPQGQIERIGDFVKIRAVSDEIPTFEQLHQIGPKFFRSGKNDAWRQAFSEREHLEFWIRHQTQMLRYGYTTGRPVMLEMLPELPAFMEIIGESRGGNAVSDASVLATLEGRLDALQAGLEQAHAALKDLADGVSAALALPGGAAGVVAADSPVVPDSPEYANSLNARGERCFSEGRLDEAEQLFLQAVRTAPGFADGYNNLGVLAWERDDAVQAMEFFEAGLRLDPLHRDLMNNAVGVLEATGRLDEARRLSEQFPVDSPEIRDGAVELHGTSDAPGVEPAAGRLLAEGERAFQAGDPARAEQLFLDAGRHDPGRAEVWNNLMVLYWQQGDSRQAAECLAKAIGIAPADRNVVVNGGQLLAALGLVDDARFLYRNYLSRHPADPEVSRLCAAVSDGCEAVVPGPSVPENAQPARVVEPVEQAESSGPEAPEAGAGPHEPILIATSIAPSGLGKQKRAIQSWIDAGYEALSVNVPGEIALLQPEFPDVHFIEAGRDGRELCGKPCVFIDDLLAALAASGRSIVGIVNSDIMFRPDARQAAVLREQAAGKFLYGSRIDVDDPQSRQGRRCHCGYDFFFFHSGLISEIPSSRFLLGMPWWDYWLPLAMREAGVPLFRVEDDIAFHVVHEQAYDGEHERRWGDDLAERFPEASFTKVFRQCFGTLFEYAAYMVLSDRVRDVLARSSDRVRLSAEPRKDTENDAPRVTAIVSTYESGDFIGECLDDLVKQTIADQIEVIVIDANSPQNERAVVEEFQRRHPDFCLRYHRTDERIGVYPAWNLAVGMARGEYLITCSTNDRLRRDACEIMARALDEEPGVALVYGNSYLSFEPHDSPEQPTLGGIYLWPDYNFEQLLERCMVGPHPMWRREIHETVGYFEESLVALGDQDFWLRVGERYPMKNLPDFTGLFYVTPDSVSGNLDLSRMEFDRIHPYYRWRHRYGKWFPRRQDRSGPEYRSGGGERILVVVAAPQGPGKALADTLDSIAAQTWENWELVIVSDAASPGGAFGQEQGLDWVCKPVDQTLTDALHQVISSHPACWVSVVHAGDVLEAACLRDCVEHAARNPDWKLVYTDHDLHEPGGELLDPRFKPDWDPDLHRATGFVGVPALMNRDALLEAGSLGRFEQAWSYDTVLRMHERFGPGSIGHVADIRMHLDAARVQRFNDESHTEMRQALEECLQRTGEAAVVQEGLVPGAYMVEPRFAAHPAVTVVVAAGAAEGNLAQSLVPMLEKTGYPNLSVDVLVYGEGCGADLSGLRQWAEETGRVTVFEYPGARNYCEVVNHHVSEHGGDYLLVVSAGLTVLQENWVERLLQLVVPEHTGIVGARVVDGDKRVVDAGILLGAGRNSIGRARFEGLHMVSPGYMGRAQQVQEVGALSGLCFMVGREQFNTMGGFNAGLAHPVHASIDLCLRMRAAGSRVLWTPHSTLMDYAGAAGLHLAPLSDPDCGEAETVLKRWLPELANDPSFNPNLSLATPDFRLEVDTIRGWDPSLDTGLRVVGFGSGSRGSWEYRVRQPLDVLAQTGRLLRTHSARPGSTELVVPSVAEMARLAPDTLLMHNTIHDGQMDAMESYKRHCGVFIVFSQDDLMTALPPSNPYSKTVYRDMKKRVRRALSLADRFVVTTEPLADAFREYIEDIVVVPNRLDKDVWGSLESRKGVSAKPRVGWAGAMQHLGDLRILEEVVRATADEVDWVFMGMCPDFLRPRVREFHPGVPYDQYPEKLASLDIDLAVAPLEYNAFNEAKSNLRILEYGALGLPAITTDIEPYRNAPVHRVPNVARVWIEAIRERIHDPDAAAREGEALHRWVRENGFLQDHPGEWMSVLSPSVRVENRESSGLRAAG